jgi:glycosyltransferase involved in cell wall biosynthesis
LIDPVATTEPAVSIVIPTYNRGHLLPRCLDSLLAQTWTNFELIVVDDGSVDATPDVLARYIEQDARVRSVRQQNGGGCAARNAGVASAISPIITFLDSDDEVQPEWLEALVSPLCRGADVSCCGHEMKRPDGEVFLVRRPRDWSAGRATSQVSGGLFISGTFALRRELFEAAGGYTVGLPANHHSEFRLRLLRILVDTQGRLDSTDRLLAIGHEHTGPNIRSNTQAIYDSAVFVIDKHYEQLRLCPRTLASWATAAGGCAAKLGQFREARQRFGQAIRNYPRDSRNYLRWMVSNIPGLRRIAWPDSNRS